MATTTTVTTSDGKPGYKTSEFWVVVITSLFTWINQSGLLGAFQIPIEALSDLISLAIVYILGRTGIKAATDVTAKIKNTGSDTGTAPNPPVS